MRSKFWVRSAPLSVLTLLVLGACGSSKDQSLESQAIDGYIVKAAVLCDSESGGVTAIAGRLTCPKDTLLVTVSGGWDVGFDETAVTSNIVFVGELRAPANLGYATPLSTVAVQMASTEGGYQPDLWEEKVAALGSVLGDTALDLKKDPSDTENNMSLIRSNAQIHQVISAFSKSQADYGSAIAAFATVMTKNAAASNTVDLGSNVSQTFREINEALPSESGLYKEPDELESSALAVATINQAIAAAEAAEDLDTVALGAAVPDSQIPVTEVPVTEVPVTEVPVTEVPDSEIPVTEVPVTEVPVTEAPVTEVPVTEVPVTEVSVTEAPVTEAPVTEAPVTEVPVTEAPVTEAPVTEAPVTEVPVTEAPVTEVPVTEVPVTEVPVTEVPVTEAPDTVVDVVVEAAVARASVTIDRSAQSVSLESNNGTFFVLSIDDFEDNTLSNGSFLTQVDSGLIEVGYENEVLQFDKDLDDVQVTMGFELKSTSDSRGLSFYSDDIHLSAAKGQSDSLVISVPDGATLHAVGTDSLSTTTTAEVLLEGANTFSNSNGRFSVNYGSIVDKLENLGFEDIFANAAGNYEMTLIIGGIQIKEQNTSGVVVPATGYDISVGEQQRSGAGFKGYISYLD